MSLEMVRAGECGSGVQLSSAEESPLTLMSLRAGSSGWIWARTAVLSLAERSLKQTIWAFAVPGLCRGWWVGDSAPEEVRGVLTPGSCACYSETYRDMNLFYTVTIY